MDAWRKSAVHGEAEVLDQLVRRRTLEKAHFLEVAAPVGAPSAIVQPVIDHAAAILGAPVKMTTLAQLESALNAANDADTPAAANANDSDEPMRLAAILAAQARTAETLKPPVEAEDVAPDESDFAPAAQDAESANTTVGASEPATPFKRPHLQTNLQTSEKQAENTVTGLALLGLVGAGALSIGIAGLATEGQSGAAQFYIFGSIGASMCLMAAYYLLKQFAGGSLRRMLNPTKAA
jgi:lysozyme